MMPGSDLAHVIQTRNYLRDPADGPLYQELYKEYSKPPILCERRSPIARRLLFITKSVG